MTSQKLREKKVKVKKVERRKKKVRLGKSTRERGNEAERSARPGRSGRHSVDGVCPSYLIFKMCLHPQHCPRRRMPVTDLPEI